MTVTKPTGALTSDLLFAREEKVGERGRERLIAVISGIIQLGYLTLFLIVCCNKGD